MACAVAQLYHKYVIPAGVATKVTGSAVMMPATGNAWTVTDTLS